MTTGIMNYQFIPHELAFIFHFVIDFSIQDTTENQHKNFKKISNKNENNNNNAKLKNKV